MSSQDVRPRCLVGGTALAAAHVPQDAPAALLPLPEGGQSGVGAGEGEEAAAAWGAAQPAAHQTHPHILSVSDSLKAPSLSIPQVFTSLLGRSRVSKSNTL